MAHGIRHPMSLRSPNIIGNDVLNAGAACTAGKPIFPIQSVSTKPNMPFA